MPRKTPTVEIVIRDEVTRALERARYRMRQTGGGNEFAGLQNGFKGIENGIRSLARTVTGLTIGGFLGAGVIGGIAKTTQALGGIARAAQQNRYLAEQLGLTRTQLANLTVRGRALGMDAEQTKAGITSLSNILRELKVLGQNASAYKALVEAGGASGARFGDKLITAVRGPGGYDAGMRTFSQMMGATNTNAQRKLSETFNLRTIAFRDLYSMGLGDLPAQLELSEPDARRLAAATETLSRSLGNIKTTIGGALMSAFEQFARTIDTYLQGPGKAIVKEFADWVAAINIPWGSIGKGLEDTGKIFGSIFREMKKAIEWLDPFVRENLGGWTPILLSLGALLAVSKVGGLTWSLKAIGVALEAIGQHTWVLAGIATVALAIKSSAAGAAPVGRQGLPGGPSGPAVRGPGRKTASLEDDRIPATARPASFSSGRAGYYLPGGAGQDDLDDTNALRASVRGAGRQVIRLASYLQEDVGGVGGGLTGLAGQIRVPTAPTGRPARGPAVPTGAPTEPTGPTGPAPRPIAPGGPIGPTSPAGRPTGPAGPTGTGPTPAGGKGVMVFLHGIIPRYGDTSVEQVEADARRLAAARGHSGVEFIYGTPAQQERELRERMKRGGVSGITGFSGGGGPARRVGNQYPDVQTTVVGAPRVPGDATMPRVRHMGQVGALADQAERRAAGPQPQPQPQANQPRLPQEDLIKYHLSKGDPISGSASRSGGQEANLRRMNPEYLQRAKDAREALAAAGLGNIGLYSTFRDPRLRVNSGRSNWSYRSMHGSGTAVDWSNVPPYGSRAYWKFAEIMQAHGFTNPYLGTRIAAKEWNHWQLTNQRAMTEDQQRARNEAMATGDYSKLWAAMGLPPPTRETQPRQPSPIVWSNQDEIDRLKDLEQYPLGGFTPIPGRGRIPLKINLSGPRGVKVSAEGSGAVGAATLDRSDPSGGIEGFSPA
jgi:hypothetical protein